MAETYEELKQSRLQLLENIKQRLNAWDGTVETALSIVEKNTETFEQVQKKDKKIKVFEMPPPSSDKKEKQLLADVTKAQETLIREIQRERLKLVSKVRQVNQKDHVIDHYLPRNRQSLFVDKGI